MAKETQELSYVTANGIRFAYFAEGTGPLVLMLHGFPDTPHTWDHVRPLIAKKGYRVVTPYTRGYKPTEAPKADADLETLARDALALVEALGEKSTILVGHDWGAATVYAATSLAQEKVKKLIAIAIPHPATLKPSLRQLWRARHFFFYRLPGASGRFAKNDFAAHRAIVKRWSPTWDPKDADLAPVRESFADRASLEAAFGYYRKLAFSPQPFFRTKIRVPTVVFAGTEDPSVTVADYERARRKFEGDYVVEAVPGGHFPQLEHPDVFAERLLKHL